MSPNVFFFLRQLPFNLFVQRVNLFMMLCATVEYKSFRESQKFCQCNISANQMVGIKLANEKSCEDVFEMPNTKEDVLVFVSS